MQCFSMYVLSCMTIISPIRSYRTSVEVFNTFFVFLSYYEVSLKREIAWNTLYDFTSVPCMTTWITSICKCGLNILKAPFHKCKIHTIVWILFVVARDDGEFTIVCTKLCFVFVNVGSKNCPKGISTGWKNSIL